MDHATYCKDLAIRIPGEETEQLAKKAKGKLLELATTAVQLIEREDPPAFPQRSPEELDIKDSVIYVKEDPSTKKSVAQVVKDVKGSFIQKHEYGAIQNTTHEPIYVWAYHRQGRLGKEPGRQRLCRQAHFCEVKVDPETGEVTVTKVINVNDVGKALSPETVEGQQYGGTYMGVGRNKSEEYIWDPKTGVLLNGNLVDYKFASMLDIGPIETLIVETGMGLGPYGSVGVGEDVVDDLHPRRVLARVVDPREAHEVVEDEVGVFLQTDIPPEECTRVALLHASGSNNAPEGKIIDKLREEAGHLGANAIHIRSAEDAGGAERALAAAFGTSSDKDWDAIALHCPGRNSGDAP